MNIAQYLPAIGIGVLTAGIVTLVVGIVGVHRRRDRDLYRKEFRSLVYSRKLTLEEDKLHPRLKELAIALGGRGRRGGLQDVLRGADIDGRWFFTRRKVDGEQQQALIFETKLLAVPGLHISPIRPQVQGFARFMARLSNRPPMPLHLRMEWDAPAELIDERVARMGSMLYQLMAQARHVVEPMGVHLHVNDQRVAIYSRRPLEGDALRVFVDVAIALRKRIIEVPRASGALRLSPGDSGAIDPIEGPVTRAVRAVGYPNDKSGPNLPYGSMNTEVEEIALTKPTKKKVVRRKRAPEPKVEVIPSSRY